MLFTSLIMSVMLLLQQGNSLKLKCYICGNRGYPQTRENKDCLLGTDLRVCTDEEICYKEDRRLIMQPSTVYRSCMNPRGKLPGCYTNDDQWPIIVVSTTYICPTYLAFYKFFMKFFMKSTTYKVTSNYYLCKCP